MRFIRAINLPYDSRDRVLDRNRFWKTESVLIGKAAFLGNVRATAQYSSFGGL